MSIKLVEVGTEVGYDYFVQNYTPYPNNRDHEKRVKKQIHLNGVTTPMQTIVSVAILNDFNYIIDGNGRTYAWREGFLTKPESVFLNLYYCETKKDAQDLYSSFDNKTATMTVGDINLHVRKSERFNPTSPLCKNSSWLGGARLAFNMKKSSEDEVLRKSIPLLIEIDKLGFEITKNQRKQKWTTGVRGSILSSFMESEECAILFWESYYNEDLSNPYVAEAYKLSVEVGLGTTEAALLHRDMFDEFKKFVKGLTGEEL